MKNICFYGCEKEAKFQLRNGRWCCSFSQNACEAKKKRRLIKVKNPKPELCENGCGKEAKFQLRNGKWYCNPDHRKCPNNKLKYGQSGEKNPMFGKKLSVESRLKLGKSLRGRKFKPETIELFRQRSLGKNNPRFGKPFKHKPEFFIKMRKTMEERGYWNKPENLDGYERYKRQVYYYTNISISKKFTKEEIQNRGRLTGKHIHIDHIFSIIEGFNLKISPEIIGCKSNIRILSVHDNCSKHKKCEFSKEELFKKYEEEMNSENVEYSG